MLWYKELLLLGLIKKIENVTYVTIEKKFRALVEILLLLGVKKWLVYFRA